jgi:steroid delta-isomerase-like uncharacterized protein
MPLLPRLSRRAALHHLSSGGLATVLLTHRVGMAAAQDASPAASATALADLLAAYHAAWNAHDDGSQVAALFTADGTYEDVPAGLVLHGPDEIAGYVAANFAGFPDVTLTTTRTPAGLGFGAGTWAAKEWVYAGTYTGQYPGLPPGTGLATSLRGVDVLELRDGQIAHVRSYYDQYTFLAQLGLLPSPETPATPVP